jgi:hypothetical protein
MKGRTGETDVWMDGRVGRRTGGRKNAWMEARVNVPEVD